MEWKQALRQSIDYMEQHLLEEIHIETVAQQVHISPFYFQRGFQLVTGYSVKTYLRSRRLYLAALDLIHRKEKIIDLAYRYGYETPESFTKAFTRFHGVSPSQIEGDASRIRTFLPLKIRIAVQGGSDMQYEIVTMDEIPVLGIHETFSMTDSYEKIPRFWDKYVKNCTRKQYALEILSKLKRCKVGEFGVCIDADSKDGTFRYMIAGRYDGGDVPEGIEVYTIPAATWAKFRCVGPMPGALQAVNTRIFKEWLPGNPHYETAGGYSIEWYSCGDTQAMDYESEIWIPLQKK